MITASVSGERTVARGLGTLAARLSDLSPAFRALGARMRDVAVPVTPFLTGRLARSLLARDAAQGLTFGSDVVYAGVQNYGWPRRNIIGRHFLTPAEELADREGPQEIEDLLTATARRAGLVAA